MTAWEAIQFMCGRYSLTRRQTEVAERFAVENILCDEGQPRFNIAPSQMVPAVVNIDGKRTLVDFKWGLIPFWTKDLKQSKAMINARAETAAQKPSFKKCLTRRRCLLPADGFFEWKKDGKQKTPMYIHLPGRPLFAFAGLWDEWRSPDGEVVRTCTILTTTANNTMAPVHDRMPVILRPESEPLWLDCAQESTVGVEALMVPYADDQITMHAVSSKVNSAKVDLPELVEPASV